MAEKTKQQAAEPNASTDKPTQLAPAPKKTSKGQVVGQTVFLVLFAALALTLAITLIVESQKSAAEDTSINWFLFGISLTTMFVSFSLVFVLRLKSKWLLPQSDLDNQRAKTRFAIKWTVNALLLLLLLCSVCGFLDSLITSTTELGPTFQKSYDAIREVSLVTAVVIIVLATAIVILQGIVMYSQSSRETNVLCQTALFSKQIENDQEYLVFREEGGPSGVGPNMYRKNLKTNKEQYKLSGESDWKPIEDNKLGINSISCETEIFIKNENADFVNNCALFKWVDAIRKACSDPSNEDYTQGQARVIPKLFNLRYRGGSQNKSDWNSVPAQQQNE